MSTQEPEGQPVPQQPPVYPPAGATYPADASAPWGRDALGRPLSSKSKIVAGILQLFLGGLGIGRFYTGHTGMAIAQLLTCGGLGIWALIDGILFLVKDDRTDSRGLILRS